MKVIIDLIEDVRESIGNEGSFTLCVMGLQENENGELSASWQSNINRFRLDEEQKKMFLFMGKKEALKVGTFLETVDALGNEAMMYELCVSYTRQSKRIDASLMGFGESLREKEYRLFIPA